MGQQSEVPDRIVPRLRRFAKKPTGGEKHRSGINPHAPANHTQTRKSIKRVFFVKLSFQIRRNDALYKNIYPMV